MSDMSDRIEALLDETAAAHHRAFSDTQGVDPEWPSWYAEHLHDPLNELLGTTMTRSELIYLLVRLDAEQKAQAPGVVWSRYDARYLAEQYS